MRRSICHLCTSFGSVFVFVSVLGLFWVLFLCFVRVLFVVFVCVFSGYVDMIWHGATRDAATRRTFVAGRSTSVTLLRATRMMGSSRKPGSGGSGGRAPRGLTVGGTPCPRSTHSLLRVGPDPRPTHFERCSLCHCSLDSPLALPPLTLGGPPRHDPTSDITKRGERIFMEGAALHQILLGDPAWSLRVRMRTACVRLTDACVRPPQLCVELLSVFWTRGFLVLKYDTLGEQYC